MLLYLYSSKRILSVVVLNELAGTVYRKRQDCFAISSSLRHRRNKSGNMSIFDTLAENRYQQWLVDQSKPGYTPPDNVSKTANRTSFEAQLYQQMISYLDKAEATELQGRKEAARIRGDLISRAQALHIQLTVSLEKKNLPLVAATLTRSFRNRMEKLKS